MVADECRYIAESGSLAVQEVRVSDEEARLDEERRLTRRWHEGLDHRQQETTRRT